MLARAKKVRHQLQASHLTVVDSATEQRRRISVMQFAVFQPAKPFMCQLDVHSLVTSHFCLIISYWVVGLTPYVVIVSLPFRPHDFEYKFIFLAFTVVAERAQDTVVWALGFRWVDTEPFARRV